MENSLIPATEELNCYQLMAKTASSSKFFNQLGGDAGILSIMLMAREIGIPPMTAIMGGIWNIQGKIELSARLMNSMIRKAGHKIEIKECSDTKCVLKGVRKDTSEFCEVSLVMEEAKKAGMYKAGGVWDKFPSDMLFARTLSRLARRLFPDVIGTAYVEGEISEQKDAAKTEAASAVIDIVDSEEDKPKPATISQTQYEIIQDLIGDDVKYMGNWITYFKGKGKCSNTLEDLHADSYEFIIKKIMERRTLIEVEKKKLEEQKEEEREEVGVDETY